MPADLHFLDLMVSVFQTMRNIVITTATDTNVERLERQSCGVAANAAATRSHMGRGAAAAAWLEWLWRGFITNKRIDTQLNKTKITWTFILLLTLIIILDNNTFYSCHLSCAARTKFSLSFGHGLGQWYVENLLLPSSSHHRMCVQMLRKCNLYDVTLHRYIAAAAATLTRAIHYIKQNRVMLQISRAPNFHWISMRTDDDDADDDSHIC